MEIYATRDSVCAGDDVDAPHAQRFSFPDSMPIEEVIEKIVVSGYLASIHGGRATWSAVSGFPISVIAQQWEKPQSVRWQPAESSRLQERDGVVGLHFNYHARCEPEMVLEVLRRLKLSAF